MSDPLPSKSFTTLCTPVSTSSSVSSGFSTIIVSYKFFPVLITTPFGLAARDCEQGVMAAVHPCWQGMTPTAAPSLTPPPTCTASALLTASQCSNPQGYHTTNTHTNHACYSGQGH